MLVWGGCAPLASYCATRRLSRLPALGTCRRLSRLPALGTCRRKSRPWFGRTPSMSHLNEEFIASLPEVKLCACHTSNPRKSNYAASTCFADGSQGDNESFCKTAGVWDGGASNNYRNEGDRLLESLAQGQVRQRQSLHFLPQSYHRWGLYWCALQYMQYGPSSRSEPPPFVF